MTTNINTLFQDIAVFSHLPMQDVMSIFRNIQLLNVNQGQTIIHHGDRADHYYAIEREHVEVW